MKQTTYPDFGALANVFAKYRASVHAEPLLAENALDRMFAEAPVRANSIRRGRTQWMLSISSLVIVSMALFAVIQNNNERALLPHPQIPPALDTALVDTSASLSAEAPEFEFRVSAIAYSARQNLDSAVRHDPNLGIGWKIADWTQLKIYCATSARVDSLIESVGWALFDTNGRYDSTQNLFVRWNHKTFWNKDTSGWSFFATRVDHNPPHWYQINDQIDNNHLVLGSWTDHPYRVLAVRMKDIHKTLMHK